MSIFDSIRNPEDILKDPEPIVLDPVRETEKLLVMINLAFNHLTETFIRRIIFNDRIENEADKTHYFEMVGAVKQRFLREAKILFDSTYKEENHDEMVQNLTKRFINFIEMPKVDDKPVDEAA